jgi:3,4-dihydroxy 2-butanone 4-phosphate synthase
VNPHVCACSCSLPSAAPSPSSAVSPLPSVPAPTLPATPSERVRAALASLRRGEGVLVVDDEDRENEGDLIYAASSLTEAQMALLIRECSGIVCLCLPEEKIRELDLPPMVAKNTSPYQTAFTVSIEASEGVTTGVSAADRVRTVKAAVAEGARPEDLRRPGHVFPLCARPGGVLERRGHTEATVDLMHLAGLPPYGVLCELTNPDGTMARLPEILRFGAEHGLPVVTVEDLVAHRRDVSRERAEI